MADGRWKIMMKFEDLEAWQSARKLTGQVIEDNFPGCADTAVQLREQTASTGRLVTGLIQSTERRRPGKILSHLPSSTFDEQRSCDKSRRFGQSLPHRPGGAALRGRFDDIA
jgi:hypothetical protein